jgi:hypothetical protein
MPNRMIRSDILDSERVARQPAEGRWLFVAIALIADDVGLFEATEFNLARKANIARESIPMLLQSLVDSDLVRLYQGPGMRMLGFIPRFGQRLQITRSKLPPPPPALYADDEEASKKFKHLAEKAPVDPGDPAVVHGDPPPEEEVEEKKKGLVSVASQPRQRPAAYEPPAVDHQGVVEAFNRELPELPRVKADRWGDVRQKALRTRWREIAAC